MTNPVHLVLGGAGGIGRALAARLRDTGARPVLAGRDAERLEATARPLDAPWHVVDARDVEAVGELVARVREEHGRLDGIANCVGSLLLKPAHATKPAEFDETVATNLGSAFAVVRAAGRTMRKGGGAVVLLSTAAAEIGLPNHEAIAAAKAGVTGLARSAAATYAPQRIRINVVAPGLVRTPLTERVTANDATRTASEALHALGRLGEPEDIARTIAFLLDPDNDWITGQVWAVDGGLSRVRR